MAKTRKTSRKASRKTQRKGTRKAGTSSWAQSVNRVYAELKRKDRNASLGDAMKEASRRRKAGTL